MASIQVEYHEDGKYGLPVPYLYIDSVNESRYEKEILSCISKIVRTKYQKQSGDFKGSERLCANTDDIYYNKEDGIWLIRSTLKRKSEQNVSCIEVHKKVTNTGIIYNTYDVIPVFRVYIVKCPKVVPRVVPEEEKNLHEKFIDELQNRVNRLL